MWFSVSVFYLIIKLNKHRPERKLSTLTTTTIPCAADGVIMSGGGVCIQLLAKLLRVKWTLTLAAQIRLSLHATRESAGKLTEPLLWVSPALLGNAPLPVSPASSRLYPPPSPAPKGKTAACPERTSVLTHCRSLQPDHHLQ